MRFELRMPSPDSVASGQTAVFRFPIGNRFHELQLAYSGITLAQMEEIRIYANGKSFQTFSGADRDKFNQFDQLSASSGILKIPFDRQGLKTLAAEEETAIDTGAINQAKVAALNIKNPERITSFYMEIDIAAGAAAPALSMNATVSESLGLGVGTVLHIKRDTRSIGGAGEADISDLAYGKSTSAFLNRTWFKPSAGQLDKIRIERNTTVLHERTKELNEFLQGDGVRVPQAGYQVIDRTERGIGGDPIALVGSSDFRYIVKASAAMTLTIYSENLGRLGD
mgnify:CR=1 FL=1|tara:strand:+ start:439 stop:1284 length:846 start_codon:yes stop_codon:yes gene_type:complete